MAAVRSLKYRVPKKVSPTANRIPASTSAGAKSNCESKVGAAELDDEPFVEPGDGVVAGGVNISDATFRRRSRENTRKFRLDIRASCKSGH